MRALNYLLYPILIGQIIITFALSKQLGVAIISGVLTVLIIKLVYWLVGVIVNMDDTMGDIK